MTTDTSHPVVTYILSGPFINLARLNIGKYSGQPAVAKALFEFIFYHENSVREAMDLAAQALQATK